ncbi:MAG: hypothetical protein NC251_01025 [Lachnoclostridium sp.]|nr:hypothetical protein [Lachnospira sp.]MCM1246998.1 hypothetical protein [Lachnoclostridium sp.]MCM1535051.1 hypothetical protein [Clostridium sp.]
MRKAKSTHSSTNNSKNNHRNKSKTPNAAGSMPVSIKSEGLRRLKRKEASPDIVVHRGSIYVVKAMRVAKCGLCGMDMEHSRKREKPGRSRRPPHTLPGEQQGTNTKSDDKK